MLDIQSIPEQKGEKLPPVHLWKPEFCGDMDMLIKANGDWIHEGGRITRPAMVKMFSRILWFENNEYFLVTPVEKVRIQVEDAPFLVVRYEYKQYEDGLDYIEFFTSTEDKLVLGRNDCQLWIENYKGNPQPYISVRYGMKALIHRHVYYDLVEQGELREINNEMHMCIRSGDQLFSLGKLEEND